MENTESIKKEILGLEKKYWTAMQEHDLKTAVELTDFPCLVTSAHGIRSVDRQKFEEMFNSRDQDSVQSFEFDNDNVEVRLVNPETAIVAYQLETKFNHQGEERDINVVDTSTWIKRGNKWTCAMHTETEMSK